MDPALCRKFDFAALKLLVVLKFRHFSMTVDNPHNSVVEMECLDFWAVNLYRIALSSVLTLVRLLSIVKSI